jgi:actin-like ATPase involved in cell morphogenesis
MATPEPSANVLACRAYRQRQRQVVKQASEPRQPLRTELDIINLEAEVKQLREWSINQAEITDSLRRDLAKLIQASVDNVDSIRAEMATERQLHKLGVQMTGVVNTMKTNLESLTDEVRSLVVSRAEPLPKAEH